MPIKSDTSPLSAPRKYFFVGLNTGFLSDRVPDERCFDFYAARSGHGLHCAIVGNVTIPGGVGTNASTAEISDHPAWLKLADRIAAKGALAGIQLATVWPSYTGMKKFVSRASADKISWCRDLVRSIAISDVERLFCAVQAGSELAMRAGFAHIQLHAAHGYLIGLLIDRRINPQADMVVGAIADWAARWAARGVETSIRVSLLTGDAAFDANGRDAFLDEIASLPVAYVDLSSGFYEIDKRLVYPSLPSIVRQRREQTVTVANRHKHGQFIFSGKSLSAIEADLPANLHIGVCRDLIANPDYLRDRNDGCITAMKCHYHSRGQTSLTCARWKTPLTSRITE
jgi:2,4-dienoyl-CoA reductase-like NADH-dependent reductase (Old Yellow Enzyme family)